MVVDGRSCDELMLFQSAAFSNSLLLEFSAKYSEHACELKQQEHGAQSFRQHISSARAHKAVSCKKPAEACQKKKSPPRWWRMAARNASDGGKEMEDLGRAGVVRWAWEAGGAARRRGRRRPRAVEESGGGDVGAADEGRRGSGGRGGAAGAGGGRSGTVARSPAAAGRWSRPEAGGAGAAQMRREGKETVKRKKKGGEEGRGR
jgi:hypothetical protein